MSDKYTDVDKQIQREYEQWREALPYNSYPAICSDCKGKGCDYCDGKGSYEVAV